MMRSFFCTNTMSEPAVYTLFSASALQQRQLPARNEAGRFTLVSASKYPGNMTLIGRVIGLDDKPSAKVEIGVFAGNECRGAEFSDAEGYVFLTIAGDGSGTH